MVKRLMLGIFLGVLAFLIWNRFSSSKTLHRPQETSQSISPLKIKFALALRDFAVKRLIKAIDNPDDKIRYKAIWNLRPYGPAVRSAIPQLRKCLRDKSQNVRFAAAFELADLDAADSWTVDTLIGALNQEFSPFQIEAANALSKLKPFPEITLPYLLATLKSSNLKVRRYAASCLGYIAIQDPRINTALKNMLNNEDEDTRNASIGALAHVEPDFVSADLIRQALRSHSASIRKSMIYALRHPQFSKRPETEPTLLAALNDEEDNVRYAAVFAIDSALNPTPVVIDALIKKLNDESVDVRCAAAFVLGDKGLLAEKALPNLTRLKEKGAEEERFAREAESKIKEALGNQTLSPSAYAVYATTCFDKNQIWTEPVAVVNGTRVSRVVDVNSTLLQPLQDKVKPGFEISFYENGGFGRHLIINEIRDSYGLQKFSLRTPSDLLNSTLVITTDPSKNVVPLTLTNEQVNRFWKEAESTALQVEHISRDDFIFFKKGSMHVIDVDHDGNPEVIANFSIDAASAPIPMYATLFATWNKNKWKSLWSFADSQEAKVDQTMLTYSFLGNLDINNDGIDEIFLKETKGSSMEYHIISYKNNEWKNIFKGPANGC